MNSRKQSRMKRILTCLATLATFLLPMSARADFAAPFVVVSGVASAGGSAVAIDPQGRSFFAWVEPRPSLRSESAVRTRARAADGTFGAYHSISTMRYNAQGHQVAFDTRGNALVVWSGRPNDDLGDTVLIQARFRTAAGVFGPIQTISSPNGEGAIDPKVAFNSSGRALITWTYFYNGTRRVQARSRSPGGTLGALQTLSAPDEEAGPPNLAVSPGGRALIVWVARDGDRYRVQAARRTSSTVKFDPAVLTLSDFDNDRYLETAEVAMDDDGDAIVAWEENLTGSYARSVSAGGVIGPRLQLSPADGSTQGVRVVANSLGEALFVWQLIEDNARLIQARLGTTAGSLTGAAKTIIARAERYPAPYDVPHVALASTGEGLIAWARGIYDLDATARIDAVTVSKAGIVGAVKTISGGGGHYSLKQIALNPSGKIVAVWDRYTGNAEIGAAAGTLP